MARHTQVTIKNLLSTFKRLTPATARTIARLCNGTLDPESFDAGSARVRECYNRPSDTDITLHVINALLSEACVTHGVEGVPYEENAMRDGEFIEYVNMGDTYAATVLYNPGSGHYELSSWGDAYEDSPACRAQEESDCDDNGDHNDDDAYA